MNTISSPIGINTKIDTRISFFDISFSATRDCSVANFLRDIIRVDCRDDNTIGIVPRKHGVVGKRCVHDSSSSIDSH